MLLIRRALIFSSHNLLFASSLLIGVFAILVSILAITSGRWIHVFRSLPVATAGVDAPQSTLQQVEQETPKSDRGEELRDQGSCCLTKGTETIDLTVGCPGERSEAGLHCGTGREKNHCADEAYAGLWRVCLLYHCLNGTGAGARAVCRQCSTASDPPFKRRRPVCLVASVAMAISAEVQKTRFVYILSTAILVCGISLGVAASSCGSLCLILGAFFDTAAGLLQFLGMFLFATVVSDEMKESTLSGDSQLQPGYNYDWGSIQAVIAFAATNLTAILAAYSYRGRHQLDQMMKNKASSLIPEASMDFVKVNEQS